MAGNSKNDSSVSLLMIVLGIAIALLSYLFVFNPCMEDKDKYNEEIDVLDGLIADRTEKKAKENFYNEQIKILEDTRAKVLKYFPADIKAEDDLLFCKELEDKTQFYFTLNGSFDNPIIFYADTGSSLVGYTRKCSYGFAVSYESLAEIIDYINFYDYRRSIQEMEISYDSGVLSGEMLLNEYYVVGGGNEYKAPSIDAPELGNDNPFQALLGVNRDDYDVIFK